MKTALIWGLIIGFANLVWLYAAYYLGLHTSGIYVFQGFMLGWLALTIAGFLLALRAIQREKPDVSLLGGVRAGAVIGLVSGVVAVLAQVGYYKVIHPAWPEYMAQQTREHFTGQGMAPEQVEEAVAKSRDMFTLTNYALSSFLTAVFLGIVLSAIIMYYLRKNAAKTPPVSTMP